MLLAQLMTCWHERISGIYAWFFLKKQQTKNRLMVKNLIAKSSQASPELGLCLGLSMLPSWLVPAKRLEDLNLTLPSTRPCSKL